MSLIQGFANLNTYFTYTHGKYQIGVKEVVKDVSGK